VGWDALNTLNGGEKIGKNGCENISRIQKTKVLWAVELYLYVPPQDRSAFYKGVFEATLL
tara:strand:+ start:316 stop:495 length:180 start_codon:yes stop_codon:yes gene_type:complete